MPGSHVFITDIEELIAIIALNAEMAAFKRADIYLAYQKDKAEAERMAQPYEQVLLEDIGSLSFIESYRREIIRETIRHLQRYGSYPLTTSAVLHVDRDYLPGVNPLWRKDSGTWSRKGYVAMIGGYAADGSDVLPFSTELFAHRLMVECEWERTRTVRPERVYTTSEVYRRQNPTSMWGLPEEAQHATLPEPVIIEQPEAVHQDREVGTSANHGQERPYYQRRTASYGGRNRNTHKLR